MDMGTAVAIVGVSFAVSLGSANIVKTLKGKQFCDDHKSFLQVVEEFRAMIKKLVSTFSDIASIKQGMMDLTIHIVDDSPKGEALKDKILAAMMKYRG